MYSGPPLLWKHQSEYWVDPSDINAGPGVPSKHSTRTGSGGATGCSGCWTGTELRGAFCDGSGGVAELGSDALGVVFVLVSGVAVLLLDDVATGLLLVAELVVCDVEDDSVSAVPLLHAASVNEAAARVIISRFIYAPPTPAIP